MSFAKGRKPEGWAGPYLNKLEFKRFFPFIYTATQTLTLPVEVVFRQIVITSGFQLKHILASWDPNLAGGGTITNAPNLLFELIDPNGRRFQNVPVQFINFTSPVGLAGLNGAMPIDWYFHRRTLMKLLVRGQAGGLPATINLAFYGFHEGLRKV